MLQQDTPFGCSIKASKTLITNGLRAYYILACDFWVQFKWVKFDSMIKVTLFWICGQVFIREAYSLTIIPTCLKQSVSNMWIGYRGIRLFYSRTIVY